MQRRRLALLQPQLGTGLKQRHPGLAQRNLSFNCFPQALFSIFLAGWRIVFRSS